MELMKIYQTDHTKLGSPRIVALLESLMNIPLSERKVSPVVPPVIIRNGQIRSGYHGSIIQLEQTLHGLCFHLSIDVSEADSLLSQLHNTSTGGVYGAGF